MSHLMPQAQKVTVIALSAWYCLGTLLFLKFTLWKMLLKLFNFPNQLLSFS